MKKIILALILTQCVVRAFDDMPRFFTNGHGGYQFFYADEHNQKVAEKRMDSAASFSDSVKYVVKAPPPSPTEPVPEVDRPVSAPLGSESSDNKPEAKTEPVKVTSAPSLAAKLLSHRLMPKRKLSNNVLSDRSDKTGEDASEENHILKDVTTSKPRMRFTTPSQTVIKVTRKRIIVRKFKPLPKAQPKMPAEKNKKREISASTGNGLHGTRSKIPHKYKFTNRNFKPRQVEKPKNNAPSTTNHHNRSALFTRKPSDKFMQLHFRKLDVTTTTTTASPMHGMKEKRHLANIRFLNRRKLRT